MDTHIANIFCHSIIFSDISSLVDKKLPNLSTIANLVDPCGQIVIAGFSVKVKGLSMIVFTIGFSSLTINGRKCAAQSIPMVAKEIHRSFSTIFNALQVKSMVVIDFNSWLIKDQWNPCFGLLLIKLMFTFLRRELYALTDQQIETENEVLEFFLIA